MVTSPFRQVTSLPGLLPDTMRTVQVRAVADGSVWIITSREAMRWDGQAWEVVISGSEDMLASVDESGRLWVLGQDMSEISAWQHGQWTTFDAGNGWKDVDTAVSNWWSPVPWSAHISATGTLWLPMSRDVRSFDGNQWTLYTLEDMGFPPPEWEELDIVHQLAMQEGGTEVWVGECYYSGPGPMGGQGVRWFDGQTWQGADAPVGPTCVSSMEVDPAGNVWLGVPDAVWRYEPAGRGWTASRLPESLLLDFNFTHPQQLLIDRDGDVWVIMEMCGGASCGGSQHLYRIHNGEWSLITAYNDYSTPLNRLALDSNGQGWLFWDGMVYRLAGGAISPVTSLAARAVDVSPDGRVWVVAGSEGDATLWALEP